MIDMYYHPLVTDLLTVYKCQSDQLQIYGGESLPDVHNGVS